MTAWLRGRLVGVLVVAALALAACGGSQEAATDGGAEEEVPSFEGETVTFVVPFSPGGGYDSYARLVAPFLAEQLGATVVVENQDGAGGLLAINNLLTAEPDGTRIAIMNAVGAGGAAIAGASGAQFALDELSYVGRLGSSPHLLTTGTDSSYETFEDVLAAEDFRFGSTGPGAADYVVPNMLIAAFDLNAQIVTGFEGSAENELAVIRGDVDGMTGDFDSRLPTIEAGEHRGLLLMSEERRDEVPDVPAVMELDIPSEDSQALLESTIDLLEFGRPVVAPPGMDEARLEVLRDALQAAVEDPDLEAEAEAQARPINYMTGADLDELVAELLQAPEQFREVLTAAYEGA